MNRLLEETNFRRDDVKTLYRHANINVAAKHATHNGGSVRAFNIKVLRLDL